MLAQRKISALTETRTRATSRNRLAIAVKVESGIEVSVLPGEQLAIEAVTVLGTLLSSNKFLGSSFASLAGRISSSTSSWLT